MQAIPTTRKHFDRKWHSEWLIPVSLVLQVPLVANLYAQPAGFSFRKIADRSSPLPAEFGRYSYFATQPALDQHRAVFWGAGSGGQFGIYSFNVETGEVTIVADHNTIVPGFSLTFNELYMGAPPRGGVIAFVGRWREGSNWYEGVFRDDGALARIADIQTAIPDGAGTFDYLQLPANWSSRVVFTGYGLDQRGIYLADGGLRRIVDGNTILPGESQHFLSFNFPAVDGQTVYFHGTTPTRTGIFTTSGIGPVSIVSSGGTLPGVLGTLTEVESSFSVADGSLVFLATSQSHEFGMTRGVYRYGPGRLLIADSRTPVPCSETTFKGFSMPTTSDGRAAFIGETAEGWQGLFLHTCERLLKVVRQGDALDGRIVQRVALGPGGLHGDSLVFHVTFESGGDGIFLATLPATLMGDLNDDFDVDLGDLAILLQNFGLPGTASEGDLDGDGIVALSDMALLLASFGAPCN